MKYVIDYLVDHDNIDLDNTMDITMFNCQKMNTHR